MLPTPTTDFPTLSTERLMLRALTLDDAAAFQALLSIPQVTRYSNWPDAPTDDYIHKYIKKRLELFDGGTGCSWTIEDHTSKTFVGAIRFNYLVKDWRCGEVGYELHPDFWGMGLMTEALRAVTACGHQFFHLHRVDAWTLPGNGASDRVLEKAGFRYEGTLRQKAWFKGAFHDFRIFGRVADDPLT